MFFEIPPILIDILMNFSIFLIVTLSLNLEVGYAGIAQFGRVLAVLAGAIVAGAIPGRLLVLIYEIQVEWRDEVITPIGSDYANHLLNFPIVDKISKEVLAPNPLLSIAIFILTLSLAAIFGAAIGYISSYPALRLREAYLGITLLAFGDALKLIAENYQPIVGATQGVFVPNVYGWIGEGSVQFTGRIIILLFMAGLIFLFIERISKSPFGRTLKAMRDSETAANVYGVNIPRLRGYALIVGGAIAAIGGALYAMYSGSMKALTYDRVTWTFWPWAFMMLGGTGNNFGMVLGVFIFTIFRTLIYTQKFVLEAIIPIDVAWLEYIMIGLIIVLISLFRPQGVIPEKPDPILPKKEIVKIKEKVLKRED